MYNILLVEDDIKIREVITDYFEDKSNGTMHIDIASNGNIALEKVYENSYDLLILDIMLPYLDGFAVCKEVRKNDDIPIIFITARDSQEDVFRGYALGCDDYVVKPFSIPIFYKKAEALIRRSKGLVRSNVLTCGEITLNPNNGIVTVNGEQINLTAKEYALLKVLLENKGKIISRRKLLDIVWGYDNDKDERALDPHIKNIRKALGHNGAVIKTIIGRGFRIGDEN